MLDNLNFINDPNKIASFGEDFLYHFNKNELTSSFTFIQVGNDAYIYFKSSDDEVVFTFRISANRVILLDTFNLSLPILLRIEFSLKQVINKFGLLSEDLYDA